jgi:hypothetical protein
MIGLLVKLNPSVRPDMFNANASCAVSGCSDNGANEIKIRLPQQAHRQRRGRAALRQKLYSSHVVQLQRDVRVKRQALQDKQNR